MEYFLSANVIRNITKMNIGQKKWTMGQSKLQDGSQKTRPTKINTHNSQNLAIYMNSSFAYGG